MPRPPLFPQRLIALCLLGWLLFNYPLLALFSGPATLFGIPLIFVYLFFVWALLIGLILVIAEQTKP